MDIQHYINSIALADPSLAQMIEGLHDKGLPLPAIKIKVRAALAKVALDEEGIREEIARILEIVASEKLDGPRDLDAAIDAIITLIS